MMPWARTRDEALVDIVLVELAVHAGFRTAAR